MNAEEIRLRRLYNQQLLKPELTYAQKVVSYMAAMQAQEYAMAKFAVGLRMQNATETAIEQAFNEGQILRTHLMRPTWHFVAPQDIRWMLELTAPRVTQVNSFMYRKYNLDENVFKHCYKVIEKSLRDSNYLTRETIKEDLTKKGIEGDGVMMSCIMMAAELSGLVCSGPRQGNQFTYALLEERVAAVPKLSRQEALYELCTRYFTSRGPASIKDFTTWSGLTIKEAKEGLALTVHLFEKISINDTDYYFLGTKPSSKGEELTFLMPDYDEYGMGYKDRSVLINPASSGKVKYNRMIIVDGMIAGSWGRTLQKDKVLLDVQLFKNHSFSDSAIAAAIEKYGKFLGKEVIIN